MKAITDFPQLMIDVVISLACPKCPVESPQYELLVWGKKAVSHFPECRNLSSSHIIYYINSVIA